MMIAIVFSELLVDMSRLQLLCLHICKEKNWDYPLKNLFLSLKINFISLLLNSLIIFTKKTSNIHQEIQLMLKHTMFSQSQLKTTINLDAIVIKMLLLYFISFLCYQLPKLKRNLQNYIKPYEQFYYIHANLYSTPTPHPSKFLKVFYLQGGCYSDFWKQAAPWEYI